MKKRGKGFQLLSVLLITAMLLSGCGSTETGGNTEENKNQAMGRYIEKEMEFPLKEGSVVSGFIKKPEGSYEVYGYDGTENYFFTSLDGSKWEKKIMPDWLISTENRVVSNIVFGEDGYYYALIDEYGEENGKDSYRQYIYQSKDGQTAEEMEIPMLSELKSEEEDYMLYKSISTIQVMENGCLVVASIFDSEARILSSEGEELGTIPLENPLEGMQYDTFFTVKGNTIIGPKSNGKEILFYDGANMTELRSVEFPIDGRLKIQMLSDGATILADRNGIHRLEPEGTLWQTVVDGQLNSMSMPTMELSDFYVREKEAEDENESYLIRYGKQLYSYVYDGTVASVPENEITVYSLRENATIRQAIALFQQEHTDVKVNYTIAMGDEDEDKKEDLIRAFNTELLDGNGADIIVLDELPIISYEEKGILADLSSVVDTTVLLPLIVEESKTEDKIFSLPMRFRAIFTFGEKEAIEHSKDIKDLFAYMKDQTGKDYIKMVNRYDFLDYVLSIYGEELLDEQGALKEEELTVLLEDMMTFFENSGINETADIEYNYASSVSHPEYRPGLSSNMGSLVNGGARTAVSSFNDMTSFYMVEALENKIDSLEWDVFGNSLIAQGRVGINSQTKNKEIAEEFIKFLFEEKVQSADVYDGFPANLKVLEKKAQQEPDPNMYWGFSIQDENGVVAELEGESPSKEVCWQVVDKIKQTDRLSDNLDTLHNLIFDEITPLLEGEKDIPKTVEAVKQKVNTYMAE